MLIGKGLSEYTNLSYPNDSEKNDRLTKKILFVNRFLKNLRWEKSIVLNAKV